MKWFVIIEDNEISRLMLEGSGFERSAPVPIKTGDDENPQPTGFSIISTKDKHNSALSGYIKYTADEVSEILGDIRAGKKITTRVKVPAKQSAFLDPEGARARFQKLGMLTTPTTEFTWTADIDYYITGAEFYAVGAEVGDTVSFEVHHPQAGLLDSFAADWYIWDGAHEYDVYPARIFAGLQIKVTLTKAPGNVGATTILVNGKLHAIP